jgi:cell wall-associated NlpC family hydrolase
MPTYTTTPGSKRKRRKAFGSVVSLSVLTASVVLFAGAPAANAATVATGGADFAPTPKLLPGQKAKLGKDGQAIAPADAPEAVKQAIWAANKIVKKPYRYGGGHARVEDSGYDCSGTVSYALIGAALLKSPLDSSSFMKWGDRGKGTWITVYTNPGHAYAIIAGLRLDTSGPGERGPRWRKVKRSAKGFVARHPAGF